MNDTCHCTGCGYSILLRKGWKQIFPLCSESNFEEQNILGLPLNSASEALSERKHWGQSDRSNDSSPFQGTVALLFFEKIQGDKGKASNKSYASRGISKCIVRSQINKT